MGLKMGNLGHDVGKPKSYKRAKNKKNGRTIKSVAKMKRAKKKRNNKKKHT
tara:strand:- start:435 stop:587 length:153 start_codon:yes stop_codon:yes gene_type:complete